MADDPAGVVVRRATAGDLPAMASLARELTEHQAGWRWFPLRPGLEDEIVERYRREVAEGEGVHVVVEVDGEVVGMAHGGVHVPSHFSDERSLEVSGVVVRASARGRGVGRRLVEALFERAADLGLDALDLRVFMANEEARAFWASLGFVDRYVQMVARVGDRPVRPTPRGE